MSHRDEYAYLISEDKGKTYHQVAIIDGKTRDKIQEQRVTDPKFVRMFGKI